MKIMMCFHLQGTGGYRLSERYYNSGAAHLKASGRGEYVPVADNTTQEGRSRNRRVIIKIYNSYSSDFN